MGSEAAFASTPLRRACSRRQARGSDCIRRARRSSRRTRAFRCGDSATMRELADLYSYLASDGSGYITGDMVVIDGGRWMQGVGGPTSRAMQDWRVEQWDAMREHAGTASDGTARGRQGRRAGRHRAGPDVRHAAGRPGRDRDPRRSQAAVKLGIERPLKFNTLLRNRGAIALDLKDPAAVETVLELVEQADALIEGFRPGVTERLGLGPDVCLRAIRAWPTAGSPAGARTARSRRSAGHDINYLALTGHPRCHRPRRPAADDPAEPGRRLCRRLALHGGRPARRDPGGAAVGPGPGGRRGDRRRRRAPGHHLPRHARRRHLAARAAAPTSPTAARTSTTATNAPTAAGSRSGRSRRSSSPSCCERLDDRRREAGAAAVARALEARQGACWPRSSRRARATNGPALLEHTDACVSPVLASPRRRGIRT